MRVEAINLFMGMVELPEGAIIELKLSIGRKNMRSKVLLESELVKKFIQQPQIWWLLQPIVAANKMWTFCFISGSMRFFSLLFHIVCAHAHQLFLRSHECLIGWHDYTAHSPCRAIFREVVSGREAQQTLGIYWCSKHQKNTVLYCVLPLKIKWSPQIKAISLVSNKWRKSGRVAQHFAN